MKSKQIYVVLTRTNTMLSSLIHLMLQDDYTHATLALDENLDSMFSFGRRHANNPFWGCFRRERLDEGLYAHHKELPGLILELPLTISEYNQVIDIVTEFMLNTRTYNYNYLGLLGSLLSIRCGSQNSFLCSEFVYYVLHQCGICDLNKPRSLVRPQDFLHIGGNIIYQGDLKQYRRSCKAIEEPFQLLTVR